MLPLLLLPLALAQDPAERIDSIFAFVKDTTPGCAVATMRNGTTLFAKGYGLSDLEHRTRITPETPFYLASVSKQFAAAATSLLALDGKVSIDDDVRKHVPEFPSYGKPITIRHLLYHTSGLRDYLSLFDMAGLGDFPITNADFLAWMQRQRSLNFPTGTQYSYSNSNYVLLSILVERVSGKSLRAFAEERIFAPLGMTRTRFRDDRRMLIPDRALAYWGTPRGYLTAVPAFDVVGDGGLFSTVSDLAKWEANWWDPKAGGPAFVALMNTQGTLDDGRTQAYGFGLSKAAYRGDSVVAHGGGYGGYSTFLIRIPKRRFSVAVLCNGVPMGAGALANGVVDVFLGDSLASPAPVAAIAAGEQRRPVAADTAVWRGFTGTWFAESENLVRRIVIQDGKIFYRRAENNQSELLPAGPRRFALTGSNGHATFSAKGDSLTLDLGPDGMVRFRRVSAPATDLKAYAGSFTSSDLRETWMVRADSASLVVRGGRGDSLRVRPAFEDAFEASGFLLRFVREGGRVTAMLGSLGERVRNVRFERDR